jgi:pyruvate dehydrogenase (quinone)
MHEADLLILLGTDFPYQKFMPVKNKIVQIDESPERLGKKSKTGTRTGRRCERNH